MDIDLGGIADQHGIFLTRDALDAGLTKRALQRLVTNGTLHRVRHGAYAMTDVWEEMSPGGRHRLESYAAFRTARTEVALSHVSSITTWTDGWWDLPLDEVHLLRLDDRAGRREAGVQQHRGLVLPGDLDYTSGGVRTSAARAAIETSSLVDFERSLVVVNSLLHEKLLTEQHLSNQAVDMYLHPGTLALELLLRECDARIESVGETRTYCAVRGRGLPVPHPQFEVRGPKGDLVARLDFAWPELGVWLEFDGRVKYQKYLLQGESVTDAVLREKTRENRVSSITGWICVRVDWKDLDHPERLVARIREAIALAAQRRAA